VNRGKKSGANREKKDPAGAGSFLYLAELFLTQGFLSAELFPAWTVVFDFIEADQK